MLIKGSLDRLRRKVSGGACQDPGPSSDLGFSALPVADTAAPILTNAGMGRATSSYFVFIQIKGFLLAGAAQQPRNTQFYLKQKPTVEFSVRAEVYSIEELP